VERGAGDHRADQGDHALQRPPHSLIGRRSFLRGGGLGSLLLLVLVALIVFADGDESPDRRPRPPDEPAQAPPTGPGQPPPGADSSAGVPAFVTRVVDGDTIEVRLRGREQDVRYIGVDTPESVAPGEPVQCFGPRASDLNRRLVEGRRVRLVFDAERRDVYGRLLAYVYVGHRFVNATLVRLGFARTLTIAPNDTFAALFRRLERQAGRAGLGLWGACSP
jgi:micrococcal nuclease